MNLTALPTLPAVPQQDCSSASKSGGRCVFEEEADCLTAKQEEYALVMQRAPRPPDDSQGQQVGGNRERRWGIVLSRGLEMMWKITRRTCKGDGA